MSEGDGSNPAQPRFEELLEFPTPYVFRVICASLPRAAQDATACLERLTGLPAHVDSRQPSRNGRWTVYRVSTVVASADQLRRAYALLGEVDGVRMVL